MLPNFKISVGYNVPRAGRPGALSFRKWATAALQHHPKSANVSIHLIDADTSGQLNRQYRGKDYATNVLSFPLELPENLPLPPSLGDILLCAPVIEQEASEQGKTAKAHYAHLTIHGVLHLLGWDHEEEEQAYAMEQQEREILARLGYADPYAV